MNEEAMDIINRMRAVTISREYGSGGGEIAARLARRLGWQLIDHAIVERVAKENGNRAFHYPKSPCQIMLGVAKMSRAFFLKLVRIPVYFLIILRIFLTEKGRLYATLCSFYSKVTVDGTFFARATASSRRRVPPATTRAAPLQAWSCLNERKHQ